jgi:hypothetical protein
MSTIMSAVVASGRGDDCRFLEHWQWQAANIYRSPLDAFQVPHPVNGLPYSSHG